MSDTFYGESGPFTYQFASDEAYQGLALVHYPIGKLAIGGAPDNVRQIDWDYPFPTADDRVRQLLEQILIELRIANAQREFMLERHGNADIDYDPSYSLAGP